MTFVDHGIEGGLLAFLPLALARRSVHAVRVAFAIGFLWGVTPDVAPVVAGLVHPVGDRVNMLGHNVPTNWRVYSALHHGTPWRHVFFLHTIHDRAFHEQGGDWFPREWRRAVLHWLAELLGLACVIIYIKQKQRGAI